MTEPPELRLFDVDPATDEQLGSSAPAHAPVTELPAAELRDPRQMAFSVVGRGAAILLGSMFRGRRLWTARAVYDALTELASDARTPGEVRARREDVAARAGVSSVRTVDAYAQEFERVGLLEVVRPRGGRNHTPNVWRLLQVPGDVRGAAPCAPNGSRGAAGCASSDARGAAPCAPDLKKNDAEENNVVSISDRARVPSPREERQARRARRAAALDSLTEQGGA